MEKSAKVTDGNPCLLEIVDEMERVFYIPLEKESCWCIKSRKDSKCARCRVLAEYRLWKSVYGHINQSLCGKGPWNAWAKE